MSDAPQNPTPANEGLTDEMASGLSYLFIPAIIFLIVAPYNQKPIIKFHAIQEIGLFIVSIIVAIAFSILSAILVFIPVVNLLIFPLHLIIWLGFFLVWLWAMIQAFQGKRFNIPVLSGFAAKQAGL